MNPYDQETHYVCAKHLRELGAKAECCACPPKKYGCSFEGTAEDLKPSEEKKDWEEEKIPSLGFIRQFFAEQPTEKTYTAKELWKVFETFAPMMTEEQEKMVVESLKNAGKILDKVEAKENQKRFNP